MIDDLCRSSYNPEASVEVIYRLRYFHPSMKYGYSLIPASTDINAPASAISDIHSAEIIFSIPPFRHSAIPPAVAI
ncbi:hypothetical protein [Pantoea coffeiphila]|uniref:Uncharacterized protein n=1 Tax=Pantoea coffeiphila TaxID=1465635 RepID=A0A2S9I691_9GAMM|nr:hypothetical protein [Pantoea coffeiphila]PRD13300.1 hypothetical protein CQW29_21830 [Pantoea coffeiphila]